MCSHSRFLTTGMQLSGEGNGNPLQYSCLGNPMDRGAWWAAVHGVAKSRTRLSDFTFTFHFRALEKEMATHSCVLAWRIPGTGEPGGLLSMGSHRVWHDWSDLAAAAAAACNFPQAGKRKMLLVPDVPDSCISMKCLLSSTTHQCPRFWPRDGLQRVNSGIFFFCSLLG